MWRVSDQQHLDGQQVDENHPLVLLTGAMAVVEGVGQELLGCTRTRRFRIQNNVEYGFYVSRSHDTTTTSNLI